ncbi:MAG TPA: hypothetical protein PLC92_08595, partial [Chitinophagales bacterium]|nr:hypothetical protein [Chitinophagales bacterium]
QTPQSLKERYNLDVRILSEVLSIDSTNKMIKVQDLTTGNTYFENFDKLLLSPGAAPIRPPFEGVDSDKILT